MIEEQTTPIDLRANLTPSRRWAFRVIAIMFVLSAVGSIPIWRLLHPPSAQEVISVQGFSEGYQVRCEFVGLNLWRYLAAGMPELKSNILCGLAAVQMSEEEKTEPQGFTRAVLRTRGDQFQAGLGGEDIEVTVVLVGAKDDTFACFKPREAPSWSHCKGSPEFGCPSGCDAIELSY